MRAFLIIALLIAGGAHALERSPAARAEFQRMNPCPATGKRRGACYGYQVDHIKPLKCGGLDRYTNMQWLTIQQHKAKTKREASWCRKPLRRPQPKIPLNITNDGRY